MSTHTDEPVTPSSPEMAPASDSTATTDASPEQDGLDLDSMTTGQADPSDTSAGIAQPHEASTPGDTASGGSRTKELEREGEIAADFLETLLDIADLDGDLDVDVDGDRAAVAVVDSEDGTVSRRLVGHEGDVLDALQELARLAVQAQTGDRSRLMLDVGGHRAERRATVVASARNVIAGVRERGERVELAPMAAFERKIVHDEVREAGLGSESSGEEPHRYVVVLPQG